MIWKTNVKMQSINNKNPISLKVKSKTSFPHSVVWWNDLSNILRNSVLNAQKMGKKNKAGREAILPAPRPAFLTPSASTVYTNGLRAVCGTCGKGRITLSCWLSYAFRRVAPLLLVRKEKAHILKISVGHSLQLPDRLLGQRPHIPVQVREGGGHAAHRPAPVGLVVDADQVFFLNREMYHHPTSNS